MNRRTRARTSIKNKSKYLRVISIVLILSIGYIAKVQNVDFKFAVLVVVYIVIKEILD